MQQIVTENWIKPPKIVKYSNSLIQSQDDTALCCSFYFPSKYSKNDFYLGESKVLNAGEMFLGKRYFFADRCYSLLEFYDVDEKLSAYYLDVTLPPLLFPLEVVILDLKVDFFIKPDKKEFFILDEDELEEAIEKGYFSDEELASCNETIDFIKGNLENGRFDAIFKDYKRSYANEWERYNRYI
jgi:hypothetical protein